MRRLGTHTGQLGLGYIQHLSQEWLHLEAAGLLAKTAPPRRGRASQPFKAEAEVASMMLCNLPEEAM
jgi:hypothetical protein